MRAAVTGATGFVGSHLVERLVAEGLDVVCLTRPTSDTVWIRDLPVEIRPVGLDEPDAMAAAVEGTDYVFHVAGLTRARRAEDYLAVNAEATRRLLDATIRAGGATGRFVYVSSLAAAGPTPSAEPLVETDPPHPLPGYGASKLAGEREVLAAADRLPVTIVRPPAVYGTRDRNFLSLFRLARRWRFVPVLGKITNQLTFVHVTDLAEGTWLAAAAPAGRGQTYYLGSGTHTMRDVADALAAAFGVRLRALRVPSLLARLAGEFGELKWTLTGRSQIISRRKVRDALQPRWTCSWDQAARDFDYRPRVDLAGGMREMAEWYVDQGLLKAPAASSMSRP
jgi:dihydroflavonol-4-reductase